MKTTKARKDELTALDEIARDLLPTAISRLVARALIPQEAPIAGCSDRLYTPDEAAALLGVHRRWIYNNSEKLGAVKLSRRKLRIRESALRAYMRGEG